MVAPVISVFIPTHDRPVLLREAIVSVLENGFADFELIVSDDSPDGGGRSVVESFKDPRIRYTRNPTPGTKAANWDWALRQTRGKYCFKLDDDDRILPGFLARSAALLEREPAVASVYTGHRIFRLPGGGTETIIDCDFFGATGRVSGERYWRAVLTNENGYPRNQKTAGVFRRAAAERLDFFRYANEDFAFSAALGWLGGVAYIPEVLYEWRVHSGSGVQDLETTYRLSDAACDGLLRLPNGVIPESASTAWCQAVGGARRALPLFYLRAAFNEQGSRAGWVFWNHLRETRRGAWRPVVLFCLVAATLTPRAWRNWLFAFYQRSPGMQQYVRRFFFGSGAAS